MTLFLFFCLGLSFGYLIGYTRGWHKASGNEEVFKPPEKTKIWK